MHQRRNAQSSALSACYKQHPSCPRDAHQCSQNFAKVCASKNSLPTIRFFCLETLVPFNRILFDQERPVQVPACLYSSFLRQKPRSLGGGLEVATCPATDSVLTNLTQELLELKEIVPKESPVYFLIGKVSLVLY